MAIDLRRKPPTCSYYEKPSENEEALLAWEHLAERHPSLTSVHMFFSTDHIDGPRWVMKFPDGAPSLTPYGYVGGSCFEEVTRADLKNLIH